ncbi:putative transmembrane protein [Mycobacteroides abscessus subsp. abscessus]|nr:putative transmembrane protein [Mycobacteroides abscessus subsp. abscessus]
MPKGRKPVGLRLTGGRRAQAWAKKHEELRAALATLVPAPPAGMDLGDDPEIDSESEQW